MKMNSTNRGTSPMNQNPLPAPAPLRANPRTSIGRLHVESEQSLYSVVEFTKTAFNIANFIGGDRGETQILSQDAATGESTQRVSIKKGWKAPIGHFDTDVEIFVLKGEVKQGGFKLRQLSYTYLPAGLATGPWEASEDTVMLFMPDRKPNYLTAPYADLEQIPENSAYHLNTQMNDRMVDYIPCKEINSMNWEQTTFLPPGSARKSLFKCPRTGRATWILGLVPMWIEGNFFAGHPTAEEAYLIRGDVQGHWSMQDDPFNRRYAAMRDDGYYWRPAHIAHGPFWSESGALCLFRTKDRLDCHWALHNPDITQR
jgi:hypothetical protein